MNWTEQFQSLKRQAPEAAERRPGATSVHALSEIPPDATPQRTFRLQVEVHRVAERQTSEGVPYYFLNVLDAEGLRFPVVCWDWQWAKFRGAAAEGKTVTLDLHIPKDGFQAFTLA